MNENKTTETHVSQPINIADVSCWAFNLNSSVKVKLTELGYKRLMDYYNSYVGKIPSFQYTDIEYFKKRADKDGYTEFQMWDFMSKFGEVTGMGFPQCFSLDIIISSSVLSPCS